MDVKSICFVYYTASIYVSFVICVIDFAIYFLECYPSLLRFCNALLLEASTRSDVLCFFIDLPCEYR